MRQKRQPESGHSSKEECYGWMNSNKTDGGRAERTEEKGVPPPGCFS
jgi:hypothetical protein